MENKAHADERLNAMLQEQRTAILKEIANLRQLIASEKEALTKLEKKKKDYDSMRWVPMVGVFKEINDAIDNTRRQRDELMLRLRQLEAQLQHVEQEIAQHQQR